MGPSICLPICLPIWLPIEKQSPTGRLELQRLLRRLRVCQLISCSFRQFSNLIMNNSSDAPSLKQLIDFLSTLVVFAMQPLDVAVPDNQEVN